MRLLLPVSGFWLLERLIQLYRMGNRRAAIGTRCTPHLSTQKIE